jgi:hypothetical protein
MHGGTVVARSAGPGSRIHLDGIWTESYRSDSKLWKAWTISYTFPEGRLEPEAISGSPCFPRAMCKIGKLSFVAGAEIPRKYLGK